MLFGILKCISIIPSNESENGRLPLETGATDNLTARHPLSERKMGIPITRRSCAAVIWPW
jgi:hypothetical protein